MDDGAASGSRARVRAVVRGRVQGVGYRWSARIAAERLALGGFATNRPDGSVLVEAEGPPADVDALLDWLRRGPPGALVTAVDAESVPPDGDTVFRII
ncbi:acylphosphatase [Lacisediminihabitans profunda]|uniref:acylphosphatase n=1 Tax=Lacisediminihabitans profunda TaxID=2594790 RepID=A0A5C8UR57_9MICO|nr:acylphosphatase [Lacisediminihabitans profunda]TXN31005.1 acylphosphatase [Lacisediminihabitans profunda]